jgi:hypothetical protein
VAQPTALSLARITLAIAFAIATHAAGARASEPMDLGDSRSRRVAVRFETSPSDQPGRLASLYTAAVPAWLEPDELPGQVRVTIAGDAVETRWFQNQRLRRGSFSDFVWIFDTASGEVISAHLRGTLVRSFDFGVFHADIETEIEAEMTTRARAGFEPGRVRLGQLVFPFCLRDSGDCTIVAPVRYDRRTGYVNAVGALVGRAMGAAARSFSPLGEAIFSESEGDRGRREGFADAR